LAFIIRSVDFYLLANKYLHQLTRSNIKNTRTFINNMFLIHNSGVCSVGLTVYCHFFAGFVAFIEE